MRGRPFLVVVNGEKQGRAKVGGYATRGLGSYPGQHQHYQGGGGNAQPQGIGAGVLAAAVPWATGKHWVRLVSHV